MKKIHLITKFNHFTGKRINESEKNQDEGVTYKEIYDERIEGGDTPRQAAEFILDIKTHGLWAMSDNDSIESAINNIIAEMSGMNESATVTNKEIYDERIEAGDTPKQAAEYVLDIITSGISAAWDAEKIDNFTSQMIDKFSNSESDSDSN